MLTVSVVESLKKGYKAGTSVVLGHAAAEIGMVVLLTLGLSQVIGQKAPFACICLMGGAFLVLTGTNLIRGCQKGLLGQAARKKITEKSYGPIYYGATTSMSNPYFFVWWFTVGAAFMFEGLRLAGLVGLASFLIGHWASAFSWYGFVAVCTERGAALAGEKAYQFILSGCGVFLFALGAAFVYLGLVNI
jgi:threonine/homoserine/homoserine lactone efflux protein